MNNELIKKIQGPFVKQDAPVIKTGMEVEVTQRIIDEKNKERTQKFKGLVIKTSGKSTLDKTMSVRSGVSGVEKIFTIHSPMISDIRILREFKVRRKNIRFIRELSGKAARLREIKKK